jgi:hypothetical protein
MHSFKEQTNEAQALKFYNLLPKKVRHTINRIRNQDKYKAALLMIKHMRKDPDVISRGLTKARIQGIAADYFGLNHRELSKVLNRQTRYEEAPPGMADTVKKFKADGMADDMAFALAWKIYNKKKNESLEITEAPLGPADLGGVNNDTGELRVNILKKLIKAGTPIKMVPGKGHKNDLFTVTDKKLALNGLDQFTRDGKSFSIGTDANGKNVISSHIFKSKLFGGETGGAGPGTKATAETESAQALWCAAVTAEGEQPYEYFNNEILAKHTKRAFTGGTNLKTMLAIPDDWRKSAYLSAIVLMKNGFINNGQTFHRDDLKMNDIYSKKKDAYRNNDMKNLKNDKWNPGDIWALSKEFDAENLPVDAVRSLNLYLLEEYLARRIVGISLKIVDKGEGSFKEYNKQVPVPTDNYTVKNLNVKGEKRGTFWSSKSGSITAKEGMTAQVAANKSFGTIKVEIVGKGARGGGMGWGPITDSVEIVKLPKLPTPSDLVKDAKIIGAKPGKNGKVDRKTQTARNNFHKRIIKFEKMSKKDFDTEIAKKDASWIHAKLGVITVLETFNNASAIKANRLITRMINYAASKSEDASVYVKISN